ncbi:MAG: hypothetical protein U1E56_02775 [Bauldia sp.]
MKSVSYIPAALSLAVALVSGGTLKAAPTGSMPMSTKVGLSCMVQALEPGAAVQRVVVTNDTDRVLPQDTAVRFALQSVERPPVAAFAKAPRPLRPGGSMVVKDWFVAAEKAETCEAWFMAPVYLPDRPGL